MRDLLFLALGVGIGGLVVYLWLARMREDLRAQRDYIRRWEGAGLQPARHWAKVRSERYEPPPPIDWYRNEHRRLSWGWWVEQAQRLGTRLLSAAEPVMEPVGRHRPESIAAERYVGRARVDGDTTREFKRITKQITADYYRSVAAHVVAAREVTR